MKRLAQGTSAGDQLVTDVRGTKKEKAEWTIKMVTQPVPKRPKKTNLLVKVKPHGGKGVSKKEVDALKKNHVGREKTTSSPFMGKRSSQVIAQKTTL